MRRERLITTTPMTALFLHCRAGFESECAAEIQQRAQELGVSGFCKGQPDAGFVLFESNEAEGAIRTHRAVAFNSLVFTRQWFVIQGLCEGLPASDRVSELVRAAAGIPRAADTLLLETPDTTEGRELARLCRGIRAPLEAALTEAKLLRPHGGEEGSRLHICFLDGATAFVGYAAAANSPPWPRGIPRLRYHHDAPSRSALKLDEALLRFLTPEEGTRLLAPGMQAVDLGAAPGGWTWQLMRRGLSVTAIDNGPLAPDLLKSSLVSHLAADGFTYRPKAPVAWMVCDMVEQPIRIADLVARWVEQGWCEQTIFNLKLPMNRRYQEVQRCLDLIRRRLGKKAVRFSLTCKQLYHDREEVTAYLHRL